MRPSFRRAEHNSFRLPCKNMPSLKAQESLVLRLDKVLTAPFSIAEMAGGWGNTIMQDEPSFLVLDASLVAVAVYLLTIFHPGIYFPQMSNSPKIRAAAASAGSSSTAPDAEPKVDESSSKETPPATGVEPKA